MSKKVIQTPTPIEHIPMCCPLCKKRFMNFAGQPLENHAQIRCNMPDGNQMDIAICTQCLDSATPEILGQVLEGIKAYWDWQVDTDVSLKPKEKTQRKMWHNAHAVTDINLIIRTADEHGFDQLKNQLRDEKNKKDKAERKAKK